MRDERLKQQAIEGLTRQFGARFTHLSPDWNRPNIAIFREADHRQPSTLQPFWNATVELGRAAMQHVPATDSTSAIIVCIPRGSYPFAEGARTILPHARYIITNDGGLRTDGPLMPDDVPPLHVGRLIIADPVLDTGATLDKTLTALDERIDADLLVMLTVIAHPPTAERVLQQYPLLHLVTADTENSFVPAPSGNGRWLAGFGDIGANAEAYAKLTDQPRLMPAPGWYPDGLPI